MNNDPLEPGEFYAMRYKRKQYMALVAEVERQSGAWLEEDRCMPMLVEYEPPQQDPVPNDATITQACSNHTKLLIVYPQDEKYNVEDSGFCTVCAVCDGVGAWPRFEGPVRQANSEFWDALEWD